MKTYSEVPYSAENMLVTKLSLSFADFHPSLCLVLCSRVYHTGADMTLNTDSPCGFPMCTSTKKICFCLSEIVLPSSLPMHALQGGQSTLPPKFDICQSKCIGQVGMRLPHAPWQPRHGDALVPLHKHNLAWLTAHGTMLHVAQFSCVLLNCDGSPKQFGCIIVCTQNVSECAFAAAIMLFINEY